jgi:hypothetical protein
LGLLPLSANELAVALDNVHVPNHLLKVISNIVREAGLTTFQTTQMDENIVSGGYVYPISDHYLTSNEGVNCVRDEHPISRGYKYPIRDQYPISGG